MAALSLSLKKALYPTASASLSFLKHLNPIASTAHGRWFCSYPCPVCPRPTYYSSSPDDIYECVYAYDNPSVRSGSPKLFELDLYHHEARVRVDLPGVESSGTQVFFNDDYLMVWAKEWPAAPERRGYAYTIKLRQTELLKKEETRAEIHNGVLRVIIPKHVPQEEDEEEENNEEDGIKVTGTNTSPADVPVVSS